MAFCASHRVAPHGLGWTPLRQISAFSWSQVCSVIEQSKTCHSLGYSNDSREDFEVLVIAFFWVSWDIGTGACCRKGTLSDMFLITMDLSFDWVINQLVTRGLWSQKELGRSLGNPGKNRASFKLPRYDLFVYISPCFPEGCCSLVINNPSFCHDWDTAMLLFRCKDLNIARRQMR